MTRTVNGEVRFDDVEKETLRKMIWRVADFSGVQVLTYCVMQTHFHVLVRVPEPEEIPDEELLRRYEVLYPKPTKYEPASIEVLRRELAADGGEAERFRRRLGARMGDVSEFMKTLKSRFTIWFNHRRNRYGTLWSERFKSVLVEGGGNALQTMATYIDLNPVRAGLTEDPKSYRFCGYAEAVAGRREARSGLQWIWQTDAGKALATHRRAIFGKGGAPASGGRASIKGEKSRSVLEEEQGELRKTALLRCRLRFFSDGLILGSRGFVEQFAESVRTKCKRKKLPTAQTLCETVWGDLSVGRKQRAVRRTQPSSPNV